MFHNSVIIFRILIEPDNSETIFPLMTIMNDYPEARSFCPKVVLNALFVYKQNLEEPFWLFRGCAVL